MTFDYKCVDFTAMDLSQKSRAYQDLRVVLTNEQMVGLTREKSFRQHLDEDKRSRREIANCNERRRMQSINSGFHRIKSLLPQSEDEKMSKSAVLQQAVEYISKLEHEKQIIIQRNAKLQDMLMSKSTTQSMPPTKRRRHDDFSHSVLSSDVVSSADCLRECDQNASAVLVELQSLVVRLREQLQYENQRRVAVEQKVDSLKTCLKMKHLTEKPGSPSNQQIPASGIVDLPAVDLSLNDATQILSDDHSAVVRHNLDTIVKAIIHVEGSGILADKTQESNRISERRAEECSGSPRQYLCDSVPCVRLPVTLEASEPLTSGDICDPTSISVIHSTVDRSTITVAALKPSSVLFVSPGSSNSSIVWSLSNQMQS